MYHVVQCDRTVKNSMIVHRLILRTGCCGRPLRHIYSHLYPVLLALQTYSSGKPVWLTVNEALILFDIPLIPDFRCSEKKIVAIYEAVTYFLGRHLLCVAISFLVLYLVNQTRIANIPTDRSKSYFACIAHPVKIHERSITGLEGLAHLFVLEKLH